MRLTPRASRDAVEGVEQSADGTAHLKARVRAVPEKGRANAALEALIAQTLAVPRSQVKVISGGTSRLKTVHVTAVPDEIADRLHALGNTA